MPFKHLWRESKCLGHRSLGHQVTEVFINHIYSTTRNTASNRSIQRLAGTQGFFSAFAVNTKGKLVGNGQAEIKFALAKSVGCVEIRHKLADQLSIGDKRNECERADAFSFDDGFERVA